jgi:hypothetical protein
VALGKMTLAEALNKKPAYTVDNIDEMSDEQLQMVMDGVPISEIKKERNEFVGMGSSIGGALGGAAIGTAILPGVGTAVGGIIGGALGAFGGELAEDQLQGEDLNYANAAKEAAISAGIDVATLGVAKFAKPAYFAGKRALGFSVEEVAEDIVNKSAATLAKQRAGTVGSLAATQDLLSTTGATLTPAQIGGDGILELYENLGRGGIFSGKMFDENMAKVNEAVGGAINDLVGKHEAGVALRGELGGSIDNVLHEAKTALSKQYVKGLDDVMSRVKNDTVNVLPIYNSLDKFLAKNSNRLGNTNLNKKAYATIKDLQRQLEGGFKEVDVFETIQKPYRNAFGQTKYTTEKVLKGTKKEPIPMTAKEVIEWQKKVNNTINDIGALNRQSGLFNTTVDAQLNQVNRAISGSIDQVMSRVNPEAYAKYKTVKTAYGDGLSQLRPRTMKSVLDGAKKGDLDRLGSVLLQDGKTNLSKFNQAWKAINFSVNTMKPSRFKELGFKDKKEFIDNIKSSYVQNLFPDINDVGFDITKYANKMSKLSKEDLEKAKSILGKDYGRFNQIRNAIIDASKSSKTDVGLLSLRSKELQAGTAVLAGSTAGFGTGLAALLTPKFMARIALNPKQAGRLINLLGRRSTTPEGLSSTQKSITALLAAEGVDLAAEPLTSPN